MKFLLLFFLWATVLFVPAWLVTQPYQHAIASVAARLAAPRDSEIELEEVELFYPFDLSVFVALCLASTWAPMRRRWTAAAIGTPIMVAIEVLSVTLAMWAILSAMTHAPADPNAADEVYRLATGIIRVTGLIAAAAVWLYLLGRERLSMAARTWLGA